MTTGGVACQIPGLPPATVLRWPTRSGGAGGNEETPAMLKLIGFLIAALPVILFLNALFMRSKRWGEVMANFKKQLDFAVWAIITMICIGAAFSIGRLIWQLATAAPR